MSQHISLSLIAGRVADNCDLLMDFLYFLLMNHLYADWLLKVPVTWHFPVWSAWAGAGAGARACPSKSSIVSRVTCLSSIHNNKS